MIKHFGPPAPNPAGNTHRVANDAWLFSCHGKDQDRPAPKALWNFQPPQSAKAKHREALRLLAIAEGVREARLERLAAKLDALIAAKAAALHP